MTVSNSGIPPRSFLTGIERPRAIACLRSYAQTYTGAWFETLARSGTNQITAEDIVAVRTLSVEVPPRFAIWLLGDGAAMVSAELADVPADLDLWDADPERDLGPDSPASRLWVLLQRGSWPVERRANGVGPVTAGKLLAAKRPRLIPVWDEHVDDALRLPARKFWSTMSQMFRDEGLPSLLREILEEATNNGGAAPQPERSLLRVFDIVVWMRWYGCADSEDPEVRRLRNTDIGAA